MATEAERAARIRYRNSPKGKAKFKALVNRWQRTPKGRFAHLRNRSKYDSTEMTLTLEEYKELIAQPCFYCGGPLQDTGAGLDRINNEAGYVKGNVRPCCVQCNIAKNDWTESEFKEWALRLYNHWMR